MNATECYHIYISESVNVCASGTTNLHLADHYATFCYIDPILHILPTTQPHRTTCHRSFKDLNNDKLLNDLKTIDWISLINQNDVDAQVFEFTKAFIKVWDAHAPFKKRRVRIRPTPWMNKATLQSIHSRDDAYRVYLHDRSPLNLITYKKLRNETKRIIRLTKREFFIRGSRSGTSYFWKNIKCCSGLGRVKNVMNPWPWATSAQAMSSANKLKGHFIESVTNIANTFQSTSAAVSDNLTNTISSNVSDIIGLNGFSFKNISSTDVASALRDSPSTSSASFDGINGKMLKLSASAITTPLAHIFNNSLKAGYFPASWKSAIVMPVHKKGDKFDVANYRPISLLSPFSKIFEKIVNLQLNDYIEETGIFSNGQHGFRSKRSCETALLRLSNLLCRARRNKLFTCIATIDYSKAFDTLNTSLILQSLRACNFDVVSLNWFSSNLHGRYQKVKYCNSFSNALPINYGVPQGSVLGPKIFVIFLNQLLKTLNTDNFVAYADDITLTTYGSSPDLALQSMQSLLNTVNEWSNRHCLSINTGKCFYMIISPYIKKIYLM